MPTAEELDAELDAYNKQVCGLILSVLLDSSLYQYRLNQWNLEPAAVPTSWDYSRNFISYFPFAPFIILLDLILHVYALAHYLEFNINFYYYC